MSSEEANKKDLDKLVSIKSWASCGVDPALMGTGPIPSSKKAIELAGWDIKDVDLFEINEAFAAQSLAVLKTLSIPEEKVNVNGGAIALGHPIGASELNFSHSYSEMIKRDVKKGLTLFVLVVVWVLQCVLKDKYFSMELPVVNHPDYVAKINDDNKFPIRKFGALAEHLLNFDVVLYFIFLKNALQKQ